MHILLIAISCNSSQGFLAPTKLRGRQTKSVRSVSPLFCICINCSRVTNCSAYNFVEEKHEQPHMTENPTFTPREGSPTIHVNVRTIRSEKEKEEMDRLWKEYKEEEKKAEANQEAGGDLRGSQVYDFTPITTYEYDVVACEDYLEDMGCWVRNMPEEIRRANPDFVPT